MIGNLIRTIKITMKIKKIHKSLGVIFIIILILIGVSLYFLNTKNIDNNKIVTVEEKSIYEELGFFELLGEFEKKNKEIIISLERRDDEIINISNKALEIWSLVHSKFKNKQIVEYSNTKDWAKKLELIYEASISANNYILDKKFDEAYFELDMIRRQLRNMRRENNIININDQMLDFFDSLQPVVQAEKKEKTKEYMQSLKLNFLSLKELNRGDTYNNNILIIEKAISGIDRLVASDFRRSQLELDLGFQELYLKTN